MEKYFVPKEEDTEMINQFRTVSLLNVKGEIFPSGLAKQTTEKKGISGFSRTGELTTQALLTSLLRRSTNARKTLL